MVDVVTMFNLSSLRFGEVLFTELVGGIFAY